MDDDITLRTHKELTEALAFLIRSIRAHNVDYHHQTSEPQLQEARTILEGGIAELLLRRRGDGGGS
jgi:hypothetical protein